LEDTVMSRVLIIDPKDNVGIALDDLVKGQKTRTSTGHSIVAQENVALGHKLALRDLNQGDWIIKYGERIGKASVSIRAGYHVHEHNVEDITEELVQERRETRC
jgi:hypothetical protein